ncbi:uroporphyrinogen-III synthase [Budvicia diplopodorum]|uniref:uroporphyrinogen-III synthase n=1 Tax=Budvicia diplopodorum TaxID=1119056 RepID=UPI001359B630|nr:uroporphyrinogen-III synthase [Budvicia diplopodorum]
MSILVTRPSPFGELLVQQLIEQGMDAYHTPLITFGPGNDLNKLPRYLAALNPEDIVIAASQHAVHNAQHQLALENNSWPANVNYLAIGYKTASILKTHIPYPVGYPQGRETSEELLKLPQLQQVAGKKVLILRGNGGREFLAEALHKLGADVTFCECYQRNMINYDGGALCQRWQKLNVDKLVMTSGEMLQQLYDLVPVNYRQWLLNCHLVVVSERLAANALALGWKQCQIADNADNDALFRALQQI